MREGRGAKESGRGFGLVLKTTILSARRVYNRGAPEMRGSIREKEEEGKEGASGG